MSMANKHPQDRVSRESVRSALRAWDSTQSQSQHPLAELDAVRVRQQAAGYSDTPVGRGLALRDTLRAAIEALRPDDGEPDPSQKRWRPYIILQEQFLHGRTPDLVATDLHISRRTFYNEQEQALESLADILSQWEEQARLGETAVMGRPPLDQAARVEVEHSAPFLAPPRPAHSLVGRESLLGTLKRRLLDGHDIALNAFQGLPGVGKTALAIELAHDPDLLARFCDGVLWAGLGRQPDVLALLGMWAAAMRLPAEEIARLISPTERAWAIHAAIGTRRMLLIIDDAWQLDDALAFKIGGPNCAHILTTRLTNVALDFAGEGTTPVHELDAVEGLNLLAQVASQAVAAEPEEAQSLVQAVGGLPLALILMGGHLRKCGYGAQTCRLREALAQLQATTTRLRLAQPQSPLEQHPDLPPDAPLSLQAIIGVSDGALDAIARRALRDLALFPPKPNTFSEPAALAVTGMAPYVLHTLVDYGLVECVGVDRYTLHQTIADYARTEAADSEASRRLVDYFVQYIDEHAADYKLLDLELNNLLTGLQIAFDHQVHTALIQGGNALCPFLMLRGLYAIAERYLGCAHAAARVINDAPGLAAVLCNIGIVALKRGQYADAERHLQESLVLARANQLRRLEAESQRNLGYTSLYRGDHHAAESYSEQARLIFHAIDNRQGEGLSLHVLGLTSVDQGNYDRAKSCYEQALLIFLQIGDRQNESAVLNSLGSAHSEQGNFAEARACYEQALHIKREIGERLGECMLLHNLGIATLCLGNYEEARTNLEQALIIGQEIGERRGAGMILAGLGYVFDSLGDYARAQTYLEQALGIYREIDVPPLEARELCQLGMLFHHTGDNETARDYSQQALLIAQELENHFYQANALTFLGHALSRLGYLIEAVTAYQQALTLWRELRQPQMALDTLAGLARIFLAQGDLAQARFQAGEILDYLEARTIAGAQEPLRVYLTCYQVLCANQDPRARDILTAAYNLLQERAAKISDEELRRLFLENVAAHRELVSAWARHHDFSNDTAVAWVE